MQEVIRVEDQYYILATSSRAVERAHVLKDGDTFAVFGRHGDISAFGLSQHGLYHDGTRYLSRLELRLNDYRPLLLSSRTREDNNRFGADLTNPDVILDGAMILPRDIVHLFRSRFVWSGACHERLRVMNYGLARITITISYEFAADFADIFEVRGTHRERHGALLDPHLERDAVELSYRGLDGVVRSTRLAWNRAMTETSESLARFAVALEPRESVTLDLTIECREGDHRTAADSSYDGAFAALVTRDARERQQYCSIETSDPLFNDWLNRSAADARMMTTETRHGRYPYAGVPWFNTPFGRDGIITALALLWVNPAIAAGVLRYLAATQATEVVPEQDAEPGKILHETRGGEMAALGEVPFGRYYGSVDATPLFVMLAGAYYLRTDDLLLIESIWPNIERALSWINEHGDRDEDGFVEYACRSATGLVQQGWKDSHDSVFHADGTLADAPIALCEVQAYVYDAKRAAAVLATRLGHQERARDLLDEAEQLRDRFERLFWCEDIGTYALALDGAKRPCRVRASNAGHCLFAGIAQRDRARRVADGLCAPEAFSGWGIRTLASSERRYNPMSYHNGSIWPHDNALIAAGCARYGFTDLVVKLLSALFGASLFLELHRLPELFCGFHRRPDEAPTLYPVACAPQAWAAAAGFMLLQSCLGLSIDAHGSRVSVKRARLPECLERVTVRNLGVCQGRSVDLEFTRDAGDVSLTVLRRDGDVEVSVLK